MNAWKLTNKGQSDFAEILTYTTHTWGEEQAERYLFLLLNGFDLIAEKPGVGRPYDRLGLRHRRFELGKHVVFYKPDRNGVLIVRILHQSRLPSRPHFMDS